MNQISVILAFGFASPWLLGGLVLTGIPILIHLLHRRRYVEERWAAMKFLLEAARKESRRLRLEHLILLVMRTLLLLLLVLAFAQPYFEAASLESGSDQTVHRIVIVDTTFSMQFDEQSAEANPGDDVAGTSGTRIARARAEIRELIENSQRGDAWNLVRIASGEPYVLVERPTFRADTALEEVDGLTSTDAPGNLAAGLEAALELTGKLPEIPRKQVIIVSDLQGSMWSPESTQMRSRLERAARQIAEKARISVVNVAEGSSANAAVTALSNESGAVSIDDPVELRCSIRNFGPSVLRNQVVELLVDGRLVDTRRVDLPVGIEKPVDFTQTFRTSGDKRIEVHLQDDALTVDNRRRLVVPVREEMSVLVVDGRPSGESRESSSFYVARALDPSTLDDSSLSSIRTQIITESDLPSMQLSEFDVLILCNVALLTQSETGLLESFVKSGGGLIIFPGDQISPDNYNRLLYADGESLLPARVGERVTTSSDEDVFTFDARGFGHPLVRAFRGNPGAGLESTMTVSYLRLEPGSSSTVALWFSDGSPAIVERSFGTGRVVLCGTSVDARWGTWAVWAPGFVPMMHETVQFANSGTWKNRQLTVGRPLLATWPARAYDMQVSLRRPGEDPIPLRTLERDHTTVVSYESTERAGIYELVLGAPLNRREFYAVNVDTAESDLTTVSSRDLQSELFSDVGVTVRQANEPAPIRAAQLEQAGFSATARILKWTVLVILLIESLLAWKFSLGLSALVATAALALLIPAAGITMTGVFLAALIAIAVIYHRKTTTH